MAAIFSFSMAMRRRMASTLRYWLATLAVTVSATDCLREARGFQLFMGGAQIVPRQAPEIQFIAGVEAEAEQPWPLRNCWQLGRCNRHRCGRPGRRSGETVPRAGWWIAPRPASPAPRRRRYRGCRLGPGRPARSDRGSPKPCHQDGFGQTCACGRMGPVNCLGRSCGDNACGTGVEQPASNPMARQRRVEVSSVYS